tara:strand:- start:301 stop:1191 length:891 start_codon:yes stop_codon:yes gene_type:complete
VDQLGKVTTATISIFGKAITFNVVNVVMTWVIIALLLVLILAAVRRLNIVPNKIQSIFELIYEFIQEITESTLGEEDGKRYFPFILTLFLFILISNWIGIFPNVLKLFGVFAALLHALFGGAVNFVYEGASTSIFALSIQPDPSSWYAALLSAPGMEEPTRSVNTDLALGVLVFIVCHAYGLKNKGLGGYLKTYISEPFPSPIPMRGWLWVFAVVNPVVYFNLFMNIIGVVSTVVSHSFRLFGNIFGGGMIIVIVSSLLHYFIVPVGLFAFFGLFAGLVQAFVFSMLAVTYIQQQQ